MKLSSLLVLMFLTSSTCLALTSRLKDLIEVKGVREDPIIGYGLVIGLNGSGDGGGEITSSSMKKMFQKLGLNPQREITSKNVAAVIVTGKLPPFGRIGQKIDVTVSSIGDASSLAGGSLLVTPLKGGDGKIYAVASGNISIGGLDKGKKFPTIGKVAGGATIEAEIPFGFDEKESLRFSLKNPDFTTAARIEKIINTELGGKYASAKDSTTIDLIIPINYRRNVVQLMAIIENFSVNTDASAKIVINERTGTIVVGGDVILHPVAISHGDLTVEIKGKASTGAGGVAQGKKQGESLYFMEKQSTLKDLVEGLNVLGVGPEDLISIFQTLKQNGSLIGDIEFI